MRLSVITPSIRKEGLELTRKGLSRQTFKEFEWLICSPFDPEITGAIWVKEPAKEAKDVWGFNKAMNALLTEATGELIISLQDFILPSPEGLEKFIYWYQKLGPKVCLTGVGDIYTQLDPPVKVWSDPRKSYRSKTSEAVYECFPSDIEFNWCAIPRQGFLEIGGLDEEYDKQFGMDNVNVMFRLDKLDYKSFIDQSNEVMGLQHSRPENWDEKHAMHGFHQQRIKDIEENKIPIKLDYL